MTYDKIYCINLDKRPDRWEDFKRDVLEGVELDNSKFERISAIYTTGMSTRNPGAIGIQRPGSRTGVQTQEYIKGL
jgi:hypothetical protein